MNRREARRIANRIAYRFVQQALNVGGNEVERECPGGTEADQQKVENELDAIAQRLFERGGTGIEPLA